MTVSPTARCHPVRLLREVRGAGTPQHGLSPNKMALITSDCDAMRSPSIEWP